MDNYQFRLIIIHSRI